MNSTITNQLTIIVLFTIISDEWKDSWVYSEHPGKEFGKFVRTAGKFYSEENKYQGKRTHHKNHRNMQFNDLENQNKC